MNLFKKFRTFAEVVTPFLYEISITLKDKAYNSYVGKLKVFSAWLAVNNHSNLRMREITNQIMSDFFIYLAMERKLDKPTCEKYFMALRRVWQYAQQRDEVDTLPFDLITFPKKGKDCGAQVITPEHSKILLEDIKVNDKQLYLAYMAQFYCCLRPGKELRLLKLSDVDFNVGTITISVDNAKVGKKRVVTMPIQFLELCRAYNLDKYDRELYMFGNNKQGEPGKEPWSVNMLRYRFNKFRDKHNLPKSYKFYSAKHSSITLLHNSGVSLLTSMNHVGHSSITSHQQYLHKHTGDVNETIRQHYPNPY